MDINFTRGSAPRLRLMHSSKNGVDIDFFDETNGKHLAGRYLNEKDVKDLVEFLSPPVNINDQPQGVKVNDIIDGFPHDGIVQKWAQNLRVTDVDFPLGPEGKGVRAVDVKGTRYAFRYDEVKVVSRAEMPADTTTERVTINQKADLKVGDVVVHNDPAEVGLTVERQVPKPVEPSHGFGTAYVFAVRATETGPQKRYRGFKSRSGRFYFLGDNDLQHDAGPDEYEDFRLEQD